MGKFSKIFHHIESKDLRNKYEQKKAAKIEEEKKKEDTKKYIAAAMEQVKYNWRSKIDVGETIREGMTTSDVATISSPANPDEVLNDTPLDNADDFAPGARGDVADFYPGMVGSSVKSSGSGSGNNGGFDIGDHLAFDGAGSTDGARWMITQPIDTTRLNQIVMRIVTGNGSNGGETPDDSGEGLVLYYKTPQMNDFIPIDYFPTLSSSDFRGGDIGYPDFDTNDMSGYVNNVIIPVGGGAPTLQDYSKYIPTYARGEGTQFLIYQYESSGSGKDNYGIKNISYRRTTPIQVVAPLDDPEASSFIRSAPPGSTPKKRKKGVDDQLAASDEYTTFNFGNEFPGQEVRVGGEDPFKGAEIGDDVEPSPQGKDEVKKSFGDFNATSKDTTEKQKASEVEKLTGELNDVYDNPDTTLEDFTSDENVARVERILELDPNNIDALHMRSYISSINGDQDAAIVDAERAYEVDPDNEFTKPMLEFAYDDKISTTWGAAETMADLMNDTELMDTIDKAIKLNPDNSLNYWYRSQINREAGDLAGAIEDVEKIIELDPESEYIAYYEMDLADLKYQEAEVETDNAVRDRMESEAGAIEEKAHKDYWNNADLIEQEEEEVQELPEYEFDSTNFDDQWELVRNVTNSYFKRTYVPIEQIPSLHRKAAEYGSTRYDNLDQDVKDLKAFGDSNGLAGIIQKAESWEGTVQEFAEALTDWASGKYYSSTSKDARTRYYNSVIERVNDKDSTYVKMYIPGTGDFFSRGQKMTLGRYALSQVQNMSPEEIIDEFENIMRDYQENNTQLQRDGTKRYDYLYTAKSHNAAKYLKALSDNLPDYYFSNFYAGIPGAEPKEPINTLYDQMKALYDEEDPEKEIKTELRAQGYEKQYKDLMTAWDSADKFSKFITPLKNLSDALLGSKTAQNAKYENYKIAIAKSIMLNKPIRVNPDTIDSSLKTKLGSKLKPSMFLSYDLEQFYKENPGPDGYMYPQGSGTGYGLIPVVSEAIPYADQNIYEDEFGRVSVNDGSRENTTFQPFKEYYSWQTGLADIIKGGNPLAGRGQAQYQIVVPPDGTEPYLLYKDHAYHNVKSTDEGEVPFFANKGAAGFVNWLGNTAHNRGDGDANTGGMAGYPPNIRGDVITEFRINVTDLPKEVQETIYRHPLVTENPELVQLLRDKFYTDYTIKTFDFDEIDDPTGEKGKNVHGIYNNIILKQADKLKDFITDNRIEVFLRGAGLIQDVLTGGTSQTTVGDLRTNSNLLQRYDDYIQQTLYSPDGKVGYVPGFTTADGKILDQRIDVTDLFTKNNQNELKERLSDEKIQKTLKEYLGMVKRKPENIEMYKENLQNQLNAAISRDNTSLFLGNSLGGGARVDVDEFLNGRLVIKKDFGFRHDENISNVGFGYERQTFGKNWLKNAYGTFDDKLKDNGKFRLADQMAKLFDVSNDAWAHYTGPGSLAISTLASVGTMLAARQLLHPVQGPGQSFADAMNKAPYMPYKLQFDFSDKMMNILNAKPKEDKSKDDSDLGSAGEIGGVDATAAATAAATTKKKKKKGKVNESNLYERLKKKPFFNPNDIKPEFPENPPPKLDPKTGKHPQYGKKAGRYKKLDPHSANSMPPTGDPEIDAVVNKQKTNESNLYERLKKKPFFNPNDIKPEFPENPPPKLDPKTGMHPEYGKKANRFTKLDPISADSMPLTGDPEIDAVVKKQKNKKNFKEWSQQLDSMWRSDWRDELKEQMTTSDTFTYILNGSDEILHKKQTGFTGDGDINDFDHSTGVHNGGEFTGMTSFTDHDNVDDPHDLGKLVRSYSGFDSRGHRVVPTSGDGFNGTSDGTADYWPGKSGGFRGVTFRGSYNSFPYTAIGGPTDENHPIEPVDVNSNETKLNYTTGEPQDYMSNKVGSCLFVGGGPGSPGVPRLAAFKAVDTTEMDTLSLNWFTTGLIYTSGSGDDQQTHTRDSTRFTDPGDDIFIYYWAGDKEGAKSFANPSSTYGGKSHDGWRPLHINPQGVADLNYSSIIIPHKSMKDGGGSFRGPSTEWAGYRGNTFYNSKLTLPPWARDASTRFMIVQNQISTGTAYAVWGITSLNFQRQQAMSVGVPLDDPQAVSFIRTGSPNMTAEQRKKKVIEMLRASRAYTTEKYGQDFPYTTQLEYGKESQYTPAELQADIDRRQAINRKQKQSAARARRYRATGSTNGSRGRGFRGYKVTGKDSKGMTTRARVNPNDVWGSI